MGRNRRRGSVRAGLGPPTCRFLAGHHPTGPPRSGARWCHTYATGWAFTTCSSRNSEARRSTARIARGGFLERCSTTASRLLSPVLWTLRCRPLSIGGGRVSRSGRTSGAPGGATTPFGHGTGGRRDKTPLGLRREAVKKRCKNIPFSMDTVARVASVASQGCFMTSLAFVLATLWFIVRQHRLLLVRFVFRLSPESMVLPYPQQGEGCLSSFQRDPGFGALP